MMLVLTDFQVLIADNAAESSDFDDDSFRLLLLKKAEIDSATILAPEDPRRP